jgi:hypothetical protein
MEYIFNTTLFESWEHMLCFYVQRHEKDPPIII